MDVDQAARSNAQEYFGVKDPDYYEFEGNSTDAPFRGIFALVFMYQTVQ